MRLIHRHRQAMSAARRCPQQNAFMSQGLCVDPVNRIELLIVIDTRSQPQSADVLRRQARLIRPLTIISAMKHLPAKIGRVLPEENRGSGYDEEKEDKCKPEHTGKLCIILASLRLASLHLLPLRNSCCMVCCWQQAWYRRRNHVCAR